MSSMKRKRGAVDLQATPSKRSRAEAREDAESAEDDLIAANAFDTPSKRRTSGRAKPGPSPATKTHGTPSQTPNDNETPKSRRKIAFVMPSKTETIDASLDYDEQEEEENDHSSLVRNADSSARKKSSARLIERSLGGMDGDDEDMSEEEDILAREILDEDEEQEEEGEEDEDEEGMGGAGAREGDGLIPETPVKKRRGRVKGSKNRRSPTPPLGTLPPQEVYFWQNRPGGGKTSSNTLPSHLLLNHDEYFAHRQIYEDPHTESKEFLVELHAASFEQWGFELREGFNICLFGYGSKRILLQEYAEYVHDTALEGEREGAKEKAPNIVVVNGYDPEISLRDILTTVASTIFSKAYKLPLQPTALLSLIISTLSDGTDKTSKSTPPSIYVLINTIDGPALRRPNVQSTLAALAAHPRIRLVATADQPNFPLLWDITLRRQFRFVFHDCTTFLAYDGAEIDAVESVNSVLGRSGRRIGGRDGVGYVLRSLPENARNLYRILVAESLALAAEDGGDDDDDNGDLMDDMHHMRDGQHATSAKQNASSSSANGGIEYRLLYHKAREELVCSTEHQFRGLLKEFYDHQMVESRRDGLGTERLILPFRREELEGLLEELV